MNTTKKSDKSAAMLWVATIILLIGMLFARAVFSEYLWLTIVVGVALLGALGGLLQQNRKALQSRSAAYGLNSAITVLLVIAFVGVLNFMASRYPGKYDLTKNKLHTLSDQTEKLVKGLKTPVKAVLFGKVPQREQARPLLESYRAFNPKFEIEYVEPDKEPTRTKQANIKKLPTLRLTLNGRDSSIDEITEEKLTNALVKLTKDKSQMLCAVTGHGEKSFSAPAEDGYEVVKKSLADQSYDTKDINLVTDQKSLDTCDAVAIIGPTKSFFEPEIKAFADYLDKGGRALVAIDLNLKGGEYSPELLPVLSAWHVTASPALVVDPFSQMMGGDAAVPMIQSYSKDSVITKEFHVQSFFPFTRPIDVDKTLPAGTTGAWLAQTNPNAWGITDLKALANGTVRSKGPSDKEGPLNVAVNIEGKAKDSKATKNTRLVVFGSSFFATNKFSHFGGNLDLFLNSASWVLEDESSISIHTKEEGAGKIELSQKVGTTIFLVTVLLIPALIAAGGIAIWAIRRRW